MKEKITTINQNTIKNIIPKNNFFSVIFEKKNGELRTMVCRLGVSKYVKNKSKNYKKINSDEKNYLKVWEPAITGYRTIILDSIRELKIAGKKYRVINK